MFDHSQTEPGQKRAKLEIRDLHKSFGALDVLKGVSLDAHDHDVISILGASGSGKSTFLRCINFLETPTRGSIALNGETIRTRLSPQGQQEPADGRQIEKMRARLAMVFQSFNLWSHMTLLDNIIAGPIHVLGLGRKEAVERAEALLAKVGLHDRKTYYPAFLSGGQQQRGAIARALLQGARAIVADEPVASLDPVSARKVMELLVELNKRDGLGVIVTLHQVDYAIRYCERVIALKAGQVVYDGPATGLDTKQLIDIYGPEFEDAFWETKA